MEKFQQKIEKLKKQLSKRKIELGRANRAIVRIESQIEEYELQKDCPEMEHSKKKKISRENLEFSEEITDFVPSEEPENESEDSSLLF